MSVTARLAASLVALLAVVACVLYVRVLRAELADTGRQLAGAKADIGQRDGVIRRLEQAETSTNFCAWRDQIVAEQALQRVVDEKIAASPACKEALEKKIDTWKKRRDASCQKSAQQEWGGGSMLPAAAAICATAETKRMTKKIGARKECH